MVHIWNCFFRIQIPHFHTFTLVICFCQLWIETNLMFFHTSFFFMWKQRVAPELKFEQVKRKKFHYWNEVIGLFSPDCKISTCETPIFSCRSQTFICDWLFYVRIRVYTCGNGRFFIWVLKKLLHSTNYTFGPGQWRNHKFPGALNLVHSDAK